MGGHGGLNILPQKKWNVYNYDNRDIVEKDKKQHAEKMRKNYQSDRKNKMQHKFDVLKGQDGEVEKREQHLKSELKKDSILNHEFKRLAEEKQHVNLFEQEQKIIENRELIEYHKLKQAEWLKDKDMDYSSKFLGTYNDDAKIPWYAKSKDGVNSEKQRQSNKKIKPQRYDMDDLTEQQRIRKLTSRQYYKQDGQKLRRFQQDYGQIQGMTVKRQHKMQLTDVKVKREFDSDRERSRNRKYEFLNRRENDVRKQASQVDRQGDRKQERTNLNDEQTKRKKFTASHEQHTQSHNTNQRTHTDSVQNKQLQELRLKRLKRQQKQRKRAQQLKKKLLQRISEK